jgi:hypothetical protein
MVVNEAQIPGTKIELYSTLLDTLALAMREASELQKTHNRFYVNIVKKNQYFS